MMMMKNFSFINDEGKYDSSIFSFFRKKDNYVLI